MLIILASHQGSAQSPQGSAQSPPVRQSGADLKIAHGVDDLRKSSQ
jgi:hypothetical protein